MDCEQLKNPVTLVELLQGSNLSAVSRFYHCFRNLYFDFFVRFAHKTIFIRHSFLPTDADEMLVDAFNDGFMAFYKYVREKGFENRAAVDTAFIEFCKRNLWTHIQRRNSHLKRMDGNDPDKVFDQHLDAVNPFAVKEALDGQERKYQLMERALQQLGERCRNLIVWRKLEKLGNSEISARTGIKEHVVGNEVYRCQNKLKGIVDGLNLKAA